MLFCFEERVLGHGFQGVQSMVIRCVSGPAVEHQWAGECGRNCLHYGGQEDKKGGL